MKELFEYEFYIYERLTINPLLLFREVLNVHKLKLLSKIQHKK